MGWAKEKALNMTDFLVWGETPPTAIQSAQEYGSRRYSQDILQRMHHMQTMASGG